MPSVSKKQQEFMAIQYRRKLEGKSTKVNMTLKQLHDFAATHRTGLPEKKKRK